MDESTTHERRAMKEKYKESHNLIFKKMCFNSGLFVIFTLILTKTVNILFGIIIAVLYQIIIEIMGRMLQKRYHLNKR